MSSAPTALQGIPTPILDADSHPAANHLQDARSYVLALARYARDLAQYGIERADLTRGDMVALGAGFTIAFTALIALFA